MWYAAYWNSMRLISDLVVLFYFFAEIRSVIFIYMILLSDFGCSCLLVSLVYTCSFLVHIRTASDQPYSLRKVKLWMFYASDIQQPNIEVWFFFWCNFVFLVVIWFILGLGFLDAKVLLCCMDVADSCCNHSLTTSYKACVSILFYA